MSTLLVGSQREYEWARASAITAWPSSGGPGVAQGRLF